MRFHHYGAMHVATRITGPRHNYLAITFAQSREPADAMRDPQVIELPPQGGCEHRPLDPVKVLDAVLRGVEEGNREFAAAYKVSCVQFVKNDSGPEEVYRDMARVIVGEAKRQAAESQSNFQQLVASWKETHGGPSGAP